MYKNLLENDNESYCLAYDVIFRMRPVIGQFFNGFQLSADEAENLYRG